MAVVKNTEYWERALNGPFAAEQSRGTKSPYWRQMTHWDMLNIWWLSLTCPSASFALQYGDFVPRDCSAPKGPLTNKQT